MTKTFKILNIALMLAIIIGDIFYITIGGLLIKSITSLLFVSLGFVNFIYAKKHNFKNKNFYTLMLTGLIFAMLGDILLEIEFIIGAILFAIGHVFYFASYSTLQSIKAKDFLISLCIIIPSILIITLVKIFDFGGLLMQLVCILYAIIISFMVGKSISNLTEKKSLLNILLAIGSCAFFFSDFMLLFDVFASVSKIFGVLCLASYYPAEIILAYSISQSNK